MKGAYLLVMELHNAAWILIGKHGFIHFQKGCYVYVGSALNGLDRRIQRHLRKQKKIHWHIDYFLPFTEVVDVFYKESVRRDECTIARVFERNFSSILGFGCSDCTCKSHLFYGVSKELSMVVKNLQMISYQTKANS